MKPNETLLSVAEQIAESSKTRDECGERIAEWIKGNPDEIASRADERDRLLMEQLRDVTWNNSHVAVSPNLPGTETEPRADPTVAMNARRATAQRTWLRFMAAGRRLGDCTRENLLQHASAERNRGNGHLIVARFMELVADKINATQTVGSKLKEAQLSRLHKQAERDVGGGEPPLALAGN